MKLIWKYMVPLTFALLGVDTLAGDPSERILKSVPIIPGENQHLIASIFFVIAAFLAYAVYKHDQKKEGQDKPNE